MAAKLHSLVAALKDRQRIDDAECKTVRSQLSRSVRCGRYQMKRGMTHKSTSGREDSSRTRRDAAPRRSSPLCCQSRQEGWKGQRVASVGAVLAASRS